LIKLFQTIDLAWFSVFVSSVAILIYVLKPLIDRYFYKQRLMHEFLDFLSITLTLEASGLRLDNVFEEAFRGNLYLPPSYLDLAKQYIFLSKISPDPYTCIRKLAERVSYDKLRAFLNGYSEVLISSNDTLSYVTSFLDEEFRGLRARVENYASMLDNLFESFLILLLGVLIYMIMPFTKLPAPLFVLAISMISSVSYIIALKLAGLALYYSDKLITVSTGLLITVSPFILAYSPLLIPIHLIATLFIGFILDIYTRNILLLEEDSIILLEEIYSETRRGIPLDNAFIKAGSRGYRSIKHIVELLKLGFKPSDILGVSKLPPLSSRIIGLILAPVEYSRGVGGYLGYILHIVDGVRGLRRVLIEKSRIYNIYVAILLVVIVVFTRLFRNMSLGGVVDSTMLLSISYVSIYESLMIMGVVGYGYWFRSKTIYFLLILYTLILYLTI